MIRFRIWYEDGSTHEGDPFLAPTTGVQCIVFQVPGGHQMTHGKDYYVWREGNWIGCDWGGLWDYITQFTGPKVILLGRTMIRDKAYHDLIGEAAKAGLD